MKMTNEHWDIYCRNLTTLRDFFERPEIRAAGLHESPAIGGSVNGTITATCYIHLYKDVDEVKSILLAIINAVPNVKKRYMDNSLCIEFALGENITCKVVCARGLVCDKKVVGTRIVPAETTTYPAHTEEVVEWDCHPLLKPEE